MLSILSAQSTITCAIQHTSNNLSCSVQSMYICFSTNNVGVLYIHIHIKGIICSTILFLSRGIILSSRLVSLLITPTIFIIFFSKCNTYASYTINKTNKTNSGTCMLYVQGFISISIR